MENTCDRAISPKEAIEMIQHCKKDRLRYVVGILKAAGYEFSDEDVQMKRVKVHLAEQAASVQRMEKAKGWPETDDVAVDLLRKAYLSGVKFTDINRLTGINRTAMYAYLKGERRIPVAYRHILIDALSRILSAHAADDDVEEVKDCG